MVEPADQARRTALVAMKSIRHGGYANLAVKQALRSQALSGRDSSFVTELVYGTCRNLGTVDKIIEAASGRALNSLQPAVVDVLRLGTQQILKMRVPLHAGVTTTVSLADSQIGHRVTGVINAIMRRIGTLDWDQWMEQLTSQMDPVSAIAIRTCHPDWIVKSYAQLLPEAELVEALEANNIAPVPTLVVRPGLANREELLTEGGKETPYSPWGVLRPGDPADLEAVRSSRAGVQDEGSQLVATVLAKAEAPCGPWLDLCAGPGGKAALLMGLANQYGEHLIAAELHHHRAKLVTEALRAYGRAPVVVADGLSPAWGSVFSRVMLDVPCSGLGSLRRRPEARWRKTEQDLAQQTTLQANLLRTAFGSLMPDGVVAYVTCSPDIRETAEVITAIGNDFEILDAPALLPYVPNARANTDHRFIQLWPHRHGTDAMFCALLRK